MNANTVDLSDWTSTPEHQQTKYVLICEEPNGNWVQEFELTCDEFEGLKLHLAKMRGIETAAAA